MAGYDPNQSRDEDGQWAKAASAAKNAAGVPSKAKTIKIQFSVDIDIEAYMEEYGYSRKEAVDSIRALVESAGTAELIANGFIQRRY